MRRSRCSATLSGMLLIALVGCSKAPEVELYNNAPGEVIVTVPGVFVDAKPLWIEPSTLAAFARPPAAEGLLVCLDGESLRFALPHPPPGYYSTNPMRFTLRAQINADGRIWILKPDEAFPLPDTVVQPKPFPLPYERLDSCD